MKLTLDTLITRAAPYATRSQLRRGDQSAFRSAKQQGLLDTLYPNPRSTPAPLTESIVRERAAQCQSRNEFKQKHDAAWRHAHKLGIMDMLFPPKQPKQRTPKEPRVVKPKPPRTTRRITHELVRQIASEHSSRTAFENADGTCGNYARKHGLMDELFPGPRKLATQTTEGFIAKARATHGDKYDYSQVKYNRHREKVKIICPTHGPFWQRPSSHNEGRGCAKCWSFDNNAFYMKRADNCYFNGKPVFKVGITSARLGEARLRQQERASKMKHFVTLPPTEVCGKASDIESYALALGDNPRYVGFDGCTEYRAYTPEDVQAIKDMVELCRV